MPLEKKIDRHFVRLVVERELSHDEVAEFFDIVDEMVDTDSVEIAEDDAEDTPVLVYDDEGIFTYEIPVKEQVDDEESYDIAQEIADVFEDDFHFEVS